MRTGERPAVILNNMDGDQAPIIPLTLHLSFL